jgi:hypothetical protein
VKATTNLTLKRAPGVPGLPRPESYLLPTDTFDGQSPDNPTASQPGADPFGYYVPFAWTPPPNSARPPTQATAASSPVGVSATATQVLYLQEAGNTTLISATDINQGQMGDCYLLSSIGEIALFHPDWITSMIHANADGTETVTLYRAASGSLPGFGTTSFKPTAITVSNSFPTNAVNNGASQDVLNGQKEIWVQVLEKAVATLSGGYNAIANGGIPVIPMEELTGCSASYVMARSLTLQQLQTAVSANNLITFDTQGSGLLAYGLYGSHAYMFQSLSTVNGNVMVNLLNPWGFNNPQPIPFAQIGSVFAEVDFGQVNGQPVIETGPTLVRQTANQTWKQGSKVSLTLPAGTFADPLGQTLTYTATLSNGQALPSWLTFNRSAASFTGLVPPGMETLLLTVTATDTSQLSCAETFQVTVPAAAPTLAHQTAAQAWTQGTQISFTPASNTFADPNGEVLTYTATLASLQALPSWLTVNPATGSFTGTVAYTSGAISIKLTATDSSGLSASETFQANLVAPAPTVTHQTANQTWTAGLALSFALASDTFSAVQGQSLRYTATLPAGLTIDPSTGTIKGTVPTALAVDKIKVTATQTSGLSVSETFTATIVASAPTLAIQTPAQTWIANQKLAFILAADTFTDPQRETLRYTVTGLPTGLTFNATTMAITGTVPAARSTSTITVTAKDQSGLSASESFLATITATAPTAGHTPDQNWTANRTVSLSVASAFSDPQNEKLTYSAILSTGKTLPTGLTLNATTGTFSGLAPTTLGGLGITVTATNQSGLSASETFQTVITAAVPTINNHPAAALWTAGKSVSFTPGSSAFIDPQGEKLTYAATQADGSALPGWLKFNPTTDAFSGTAPITPQTLGLTVTATNASGLAASQSFSATIQAAAPSVAHQTANQVWTGGSSISFLLPSNTFSDPQGAALAYAAFETSGTDITGWLHFKPGTADFFGAVPTGLTGTVGIKVVATDIYGLSASESFGLTFGSAGSHLVAAATPYATELLALQA